MPRYFSTLLNVFFCNFILCPCLNSFTSIWFFCLVFLLNYPQLHPVLHFSLSLCLSLSLTFPLCFLPFFLPIFLSVLSLCRSLTCPIIYSIFLLRAVLVPRITEYMKSSVISSLLIGKQAIVFILDCLILPYLMALFADLLTLRAFDVTLQERVDYCTSARGSTTCGIIHSFLGENPFQLYCIQLYCIALHCIVL